MKKVLLVILLVTFAACQNVSIAAIWIDDFLITDEGRLLSIVSGSCDPYEVYLGFLYPRGFDGTSIIEVAPVIPGAIASQFDFPSSSPYQLSRYPTVFHLQKDGGSCGNEDFLIVDTSPLPAGYALYDSNFDIIGSYLTNSDPELEISIIGTYEIGPGETIELEGYCVNIDIGAAGWVAGADYSICSNFAFWSINGQMIRPDVSYDYLTREIGLSPGTYPLRFQYYWDIEPHVAPDDYSTITIIPEPASLILLGLGGLIVRKRSRLSP